MVTNNDREEPARLPPEHRPGAITRELYALQAAGVSPDAIREALLPHMPTILQVLIDRATGVYVGQRTFATGEVVPYRLDPCPRSAQIILERAFGRVRDAPGGDTPALPEYVRLMIDALHGAPVTLSAQESRRSLSLKFNPASDAESAPAPFLPPSTGEPRAPREHRASG